MKKFLLVSALFIYVLPSMAIIPVGQPVPNKCWTTINGQFCLDDAKGTVRVLLFNAGWCRPCNDEFYELVPRVGEFAGQPVTFVSISAQGFNHGDAPNPSFLTAWQAKFEIPFTVAASPNDFGRDFTEQPYIPNVAIIDKQGNLSYAAVSPGVDATFEQINKDL
jgi:hypothetical protein